MVGQRVRRAKKEKYISLRKFRKNNNEESRLNYTIKRNRFKALCRKRKRSYQLQQRSSLVAARNNPQTF